MREVPEVSVSYSILRKTLSRERERERLMESVNLKQGYGQDNVLSSMR